MNEDFSAVIPADAVILSASICARWRDAIGAHLATAMRNGQMIDPSEHEAAQCLFAAAQRYQSAPLMVPSGSDLVPTQQTGDKEDAHLKTGSEISTREAAELIRITPRAVIKAITAGRLKARREGGTWRVSLESAAKLKRTA